ncbi:MAG: SAM-dependent methyltransferase [Thermodesulfobacteriaceae bacterium]|nr:SAM-dependent methyltransferase [Thermodesulfobacteriaceae bacterium]
MFLNLLEELSPMTFEKYMELCLYHPEYGYYTRGNLPGKRGDYLTSPCVHKVFGATLALQILEIFELLERPPNFVIVEAGAGQGYLALDILSYLLKKGYTFKYYIIEPFSILRAVQEEILAEFKNQVVWYEDLERVPPFYGVFISNELFDAFPVHLIQKEKDQLKEIWITVERGKVKEFLGELEEPQILKIVNPYLNFWIDGYRTEVNLKAEPFYKSLSKKLRIGAIIIIDYGYPRQDYYAPERYIGTLLCYYKHRVVQNPYFKPGHIDITAHVDFTLLRELGEKFGFINLGFTQQGAFLASLGVERVLYEVSEGSWKDREALKLLIFPEGFGTSHWVLIQGRFLNLSLRPKLKAFLLSNRLNLLYQ